MNSRDLSHRAVLLAVALALSACGDPVGVHPDAASLTLTPVETTVTAGDRIDYWLRILDAAGNPLHLPHDGVRPEWRVSDAGVATVVAIGVVNELSAGDAFGVVEAAEIEAVGAGEALVTVKYGHLTAEARLRVNPSSVELRAAAAYLVQSVQRLDGTVPLVAGREGLLRAFITADAPNFFRPTVRATIHLDGAPAASFELEPGTAGVPTAVDQGVAGYQTVVPADLVRPGAALTIEVDDDGVPTTPGSALRFPAVGAAPLDVRDVPPFGVRIVPVRLLAHGTTGRADEASAAALVRFASDVFPLAEVTVDVAPVHSTDADLRTVEGWSQLLQEIHGLRVGDPEGRYHYGALRLPTGSRSNGLSYGGGTRTAAGPDDDPYVLAHEFGHAFFLPHAPCGTTAFDSSYPYDDAAIGVFGYDRRTRTIIPPDAKDLMSYCTPRWISDHHYELTLAFREENDW